MAAENSVVIVNWADRDFLHSVETSLRKKGFAKREDYEQHGLQTQVWEKAPNKSVDMKPISLAPLDMPLVESKAIVTA